MPPRYIVRPPRPRLRVAEASTAIGPSTTAVPLPVPRRLAPLSAAMGAVNGLASVHRRSCPSASARRLPAAIREADSNESIVPPITRTHPTSTSVSVRQSVSLPVGASVVVGLPTTVSVASAGPVMRGRPPLGLPVSGRRSMRLLNGAPMSVSPSSSIVCSAAAVFASPLLYITPTPSPSPVPFTMKRFACDDTLWSL